MKSFSKLLQPSLIEIVLSLIFTSVILLLGNSTTILLNITGSSGNVSLGSLIEQYSQGFNTSGAQALLGRASNALVWAVAGALFYIVGWLIINGLIALRNDVVIGTRFTSQSGSRSAYWVETVTRLLFRLGAFILFLILVSWTAQVWLPTSLELFHRWVIYSHILPYARFALLAVIGWLLVIHCMIILLRLTFLRVRLFSAEEMTSSHRA